MILLGRCTQELKIPFIASGGFCDGKGLATALVLGAQGINMGTRWVCTVEAPIHQNVKEAIVKMDENGTILVLRKFRNTTRLARNEVTLEVHRIENSKLDPQFQEVTHLMSGVRGRGVYETGDIDAGVWSVGLAAGLIKSIPTCEELARLKPPLAEAAAEPNFQPTHHRPITVPEARTHGPPAERLRETVEPMECANPVRVWRWRILENPSA
ncbi:Nitronate monooxygenase-domain-containing protein [Aspergillus nidulans var. acristatus]